MLIGRAVPFIALLYSILAGAAAGFAPGAPRPPPSRRHPTHLPAGGGGKGKKKASRRRAAQTAKGFAPPPPKLEDVLASFRTRVPENADSVPCPCGTRESYGGCCGPLHRGERPCMAMTDVLRSRYAAFAWRNIGYVMETTHPACRDHREDRVAWAKDLDRGGMFDSFEFVRLEPGEEEKSDEDEDEGFIEFKVYFRAKEERMGYAAGKETVVTERSRFLRDPGGGGWSYAGGEVRSGVAGLANAKLNA